MKGFRAVFGPAPPGELCGELLRFEGPGEPGPMRVKRFDPAKRKRNKRRRQAIRAARRRQRGG